MKVVFDISTCNNPEENFYLQSLCRIDCLVAEEEPNYKFYDFAIFMQSPNTRKAIAKAKTDNPDIRIGIIDPRGRNAFETVKHSNFLIVNSVEKADFFSAIQPNIFMYYDYPEVKKVNKTHSLKEKTIIGYHGNKVHLGTIFPNITLALEELAKKYSIEFRVMYNIDQFGKCNSGIPKNLPVRHIQWSMENYYNELANVDIGIVPTLTPIAAPNLTKNICGFSKKYFLETSDDYLLRFKVPANPCRLFIFALLGIPVVADMTPSICQFIKHGQNGLIAHSVGGWYSALEQLISNFEKRSSFSERLYKDVIDIIDRDKQNIRLLDFLDQLDNNKLQPLGRIPTAGNDRIAAFRYNIFLENLHANASRIKNALKK